MSKVPHYGQPIDDDIKDYLGMHDEEDFYELILEEDIKYDEEYGEYDDTFYERYA